MNEAVICKKRINIGSVRKDGRTYTCFVEVRIRMLEDGFKVLAMDGEVHDSRKRLYSLVRAGQCLDEILAMVPSDRMREIHAVWKRWHLNDMHAGCEHQRAFESEPYDRHAGEVCPVCGYEYGTEWKREELPQSVIDQVRSW